MATYQAKTKMEFTVQITLSESEARVLDTIFGYGFDPFLKVFYEKLGKCYLVDHEASARSLFEKRHELTKELSRIDSVRTAFNQT